MRGAWCLMRGAWCLVRGAWGTEQGMDSRSAVPAVEWNSALITRQDTFDDSLY